MAFPDITAVSKGATSYGTSHQVNFPGGAPSSGDLLVILISNGEWSSGDFFDASSIPGWTEQVQNYYDDSSLYWTGAVFYRVCNGTEGSSVTIDSTSDGLCAYICIKIAEAEFDDFEFSSVTHDVDDSPSPATCSPSWGTDDNTFLPLCLWDHDSYDVDTYPSGYSNDQNSQLSGGGGEYGGGVACCSDELHTGSTTPGDYTMDASVSWMTIVLVLKPAATSYEATPGTLSVSVTGYAPTVNVTDNLEVTPGTLSLNLTGYAPALDLEVTPGLLTVTLTGYAPTVAAPTEAEPGTLSLAITGYAPTVDITEGTTVHPGTLFIWKTFYAPFVEFSTRPTPGPLTITLTGYAPTVDVTTDYECTPGTLTMTITGYTVYIGTGSTSVPPPLELAVTGYAPTIEMGPVDITIGTLSMTVTPHTPAVAIPTVCIPGTLVIPLAGYAPVLDTGIALGTPLALVVTGYPPTVATPWAGTPGVCSMSISGPVPTILISMLARPGTLVITLTGYDPDLDNSSPLASWPLVVYMRNTDIDVIMTKYRD